MNTRQMFMYEAPEAGGGDPGGDPGEAWAPTEEWGQRIDGFIEQAGPVLANLNEILSAPAEPEYGYGQQQQYQPQPSGDPAYDRWLQDYSAWSQQHGGGADPYGVLGGGQQQQGVDPEMIAGIVQQALDPYMPMFQQQAEQQGEEYANQVLEGLKAKVGEFDRDQVITIAMGYLAQGMDAPTALEQAATENHAWLEARDKAAVEAYKASLLNQAGATGDLGAGGAGSLMPEVPRGSGRYEQVIARMLTDGVVT